MIGNYLANLVTAIGMAFFVLIVTGCLGAIAGMFQAYKEKFFLKWQHRLNEKESTGYFLISGNSAVVGALHEFVAKASANAALDRQGVPLQEDPNDGKAEK
jgi:hypothetical protein